MSATAIGTTNDLEPGRYVRMDGCLWTIDRECITPGVFRLVLVHPCADWPAGQVGFGHASRLTPVDLCPSCEDDAPRMWGPEGSRHADSFACHCGYSGDADELLRVAPES